MAAVRIDLEPDSAADSTLVETVAGSLRGGHCVVLPTETVYGFAVLPGHEDRVRAIKQRPDHVLFTRHIADDHEVGSLPWAARALAESFWPGPLTLVVDGPAGTTVGFRLPDHEFTRAVIRACGGVLSMTSVNRSGSPPLQTADAIVSGFGDAVTHVLADDAAAGGLASTVVRVSEDRVEVLRQGAVPAASVLAAAARSIVFVCTGNTCRSPLAAAIARRAIAARLGVAENDLLAQGIRVESAGVAAGQAAPASAGSLAAGAEMGLDLSDHRAQPVTDDLLDRARYVFCMGRSHAAALIAAVPDCEPRIHLLDPDGRDVADPFGGDVDVYRRTAAEIARAVEARVEMLFPAD